MKFKKILSALVVCSGALCAESVDYKDIEKLISNPSEKESERITRCNLSGELKGSRDIFDIFNVLTTCSNLEELDLSGNEIEMFNDNMILILCDYFKRLKSLKKVNLNGNNIENLKPSMRKKLDESLGGVDVEKELRDWPSEKRQCLKK
jgi:Leucine-rich repeat (LRR) protein